MSIIHLFFGNLFKDANHKTDVAKTRIRYSIQHNAEPGYIIHITVDARFNENSMYGVGKLVFEGTLYSPDFSIVDGKVPEYITEPCVLSVVHGDKAYVGAYGNSKYVIFGTMGGKMNIQVELP